MPCPKSQQAIKTAIMSNVFIKIDGVDGQPIPADRIGNVELQGVDDAVIAITKAIGDAGPRWIADLDEMIVTERQPDGSYKPAYSLAPLENTEAEIPGPHSMGR